MTSGGVNVYAAVMVFQPNRKKRLVQGILSTHRFMLDSRPLRRRICGSPAFETILGNIVNFSPLTLTNEFVHFMISYVLLLISTMFGLVFN